MPEQEIKKYKPRLGAGMIGRPTKEFEVPEWLMDFLKRIRKEIKRERFDPFDHIRGKYTYQEYKTDKFKVKSYNWSPEKPAATTNFKWRDLEISWYKYLGREMSMNREVFPEEEAVMLTECLESIRQKQLKQ